MLTAVSDAELTSPAAAQPARVLGPIDATCVVIGAIIGVGIFLNPSDVAKLCPTASLTLLAWGIGGAGTGRSIRGDIRRYRARDDAIERRDWLARRVDSNTLYLRRLAAGVVDRRRSAQSAPQPAALNCGRRDRGDHCLSHGELGVFAIAWGRGGGAYLDGRRRCRRNGLARQRSAADRRRRGRLGVRRAQRATADWTAIDLRHGA